MSHKCACVLRAGRFMRCLEHASPEVEVSVALVVVLVQLIALSLVGVA